jgi:signal transduction histidine kinase
VLEGETLGAFAVLNFPGFEHAEIDAAMRVAIATAVVVLVLALLLAGSMARRVLDPVRLLATTTRSITETDLTRRIRVRGADEVSQLAANFNEMLDRLETAFRAQQQFVDDAGHELRTPITIVRGHLELLEEDPQQRRETVALVTDELDRMSRIVNDLLVLARSQQPEFLDLDLVEVAEVTEQAQAKATALGDRRWQVEGGGRGHILADRQRLTQAIMQLAQNAVDHAGSGGRIWIGSAVDGGEARFFVRDEGPGIPPEEQERIFERFTRANDTRRPTSGGAGLGLAIVRAIAEAHHGRVELESIRDGGATFTIVIPTSQPTGVVGGKAEP